MSEKGHRGPRSDSKKMNAQTDGIITEERTANPFALRSARFQGPSRVFFALLLADKLELQFVVESIGVTSADAKDGDLGSHDSMSAGVAMNINLPALS